MTDKARNLLGLMRRAAALEPGEDRSADAVRAGKARLLLFASDVSDGARRRAETLADGRSTVVLTLPGDREELGGAIGLASCAMAAVTDMGFANALMKLLTEEDSERYGEAAEAVSRRWDKAQRRKKESRVARQAKMKRRN